MRQIIPFEKDIVFKSKIASITSISLEHEEKVFDDEVSGDFIIFGDYKMHTDTTEREPFKYRLPFTAVLPDSFIKDSIKIDIDNFTYDVLENDVLNVKIDFVLEYEENNSEDISLEEKFERFLEENDYKSDEFDEEIVRDININEIEDSFNFKENNDYDNIVINNEENNILNDSNIVNQNIEVNEENVVSEVSEEYIIYHIHIVQEGDTIDSIMKEYDVTLDDIKEYNDVSNVIVGSKLIIPENKNE